MASRSSIIGLTFALALPLLSFVLADTRNWNPSGEGCVDTTGYLSCYDDQSTAAVNCVNFCDTSTVKGTGAYDDCVLGCNGHWLAANLGCWIQSCWNQVYSCEYQLTALSYFDGTNLVQSGVIPFYPPPDDASAGACSCNLGYVYGNETYINFNEACTDAAGTGDMDTLYTCECCEFAFPVSNILNVCPKSDLSILNFASNLASAQNLIGNSADNCTILDQPAGTCNQAYGFPFYGDKVYNPLSLPAGEPGTEALSNQAGNAFTDFGADTYTLSLFPAYSSVITPVAFSGKAGAQTGGIGSGSAVITATAGGSASGSAATGGIGASATGSSKVTGKTTGATGKTTAAPATGKTTGTTTGSAAGATTSSGAAKLSERKEVSSILGLGLVAFVAAWLL